jgi:signal transduction histidine kinase
MVDDELIVFADEVGEEIECERRRWKIAVIDDDAAVHDGTRFALADYRLDGQGLDIVSARSAAEGRALLAAHPDVAVILLDVVMETETAGLDLVQYIRRDLGNDLVRIILRTGQPGQAPERRVIVEYDINDYKAKTELTADKLFTTITAALRAHLQLARLEESRRGLEMIIDAATALFDTHSMRRFAEGVLTQVASLLEVDCAGMLVVRDASREETGPEMAVLAGSGVYATVAAAADTATTLDAATRALVEVAFGERRHCFFDNRSVLYIRTASGRELAVVLDVARHLSPTDRALVEVFCGKLSVAFENVLLWERLQDVNVELEHRVVERTEELTDANRRLSDQREILRRANTFKADMLGMIAHDLKNPLGAILGRAEIIAELIDRGTTPAALLKEQLGKIVAPATAMNRMITDLVGQATADALDIAIRPAALDLADLVHDVVDHMRPIAEAKRQIVEFHADGRVAARADPDRIREAVENVVSNAFKYGPLGGRVRVVVRSCGDRAVLEVADQGPGLAPEDFGRLFGKFQRLSAQPTGGEHSTGLGLSIAKQIVEMHGGHIGAINAEPPPGTVFQIVLPAPDAGGDDERMAS